jgi:hypothetical protein
MSDEGRVMPSDSELDSLRYSGNARSRQSGSGHLAVLSTGPDFEPAAWCS